MNILDKYPFDLNKQYQTIITDDREEGDELINSIMALLEVKKGCHFEPNTVEIDHNPYCLRSMKGKYDILKGMVRVVNVRMFKNYTRLYGEGGAVVTVQL